MVAVHACVANSISLLRSSTVTCLFVQIQNKVVLCELAFKELREWYTHTLITGNVVKSQRLDKFLHEIGGREEWENCLPLKSVNVDLNLIGGLDG